MIMRRSRKRKTKTKRTAGSFEHNRCYRRRPAGQCGYAAAWAAHRVTLFEKNEKLGKKLFLTGKGRCNITNARPQEEFFSNIPGNAKFLYSAFGALNNAELLDLRGMAYKPRWNAAGASFQCRTSRAM